MTPRKRPETAASRRAVLRTATRWLAAILALAALHVWLNLQARTLGYELATLRQLTQRLAQERTELDVEIATLTSPRSLDRLARARYGLRAPAEGQMVGMP
ncbi:MAG: Cell division protein FtsL [Candidatus Binatota bacterium]|nr:Cell division protein FtsL [Candidatus Binatota bacterium]